MGILLWGALKVTELLRLWSGGGGPPFMLELLPRAIEGGPDMAGTAGRMFGLPFTDGEACLPF